MVWATLSLNLAYGAGNKSHPWLELAPDQGVIIRSYRNALICNANWFAGRPFLLQKITNNCRQGWERPIPGGGRPEPSERMLPECRGGTSNRIGVAGLQRQPFPVHFFDEPRFRGLARPVGGHVLELIRHLPEDPVRRLFQ